MVGISLDSLRPSIDRSQGSLSAFQPAMLIIPWQGACDMYYDSLRVRVLRTSSGIHIHTVAANDFLSRFRGYIM